MIIIYSRSASPESVKYPCLSLGIRAKRIYLEVSMLHWDNEFIKIFGMAYIFSGSREKTNPTP